MPILSHDLIGGKTPLRLRILARDFTTQSCCAYCPKKLTSGTGYIIDDPRKGKVAAGRECAKRRADRGPGYVDYVNGMQGEETGPDPRWPVTPNSRTARARLQTSEEQRVRDYLTLRYEKLGQAWFPSYIANPAMRAIHHAVKSGSATIHHYAEAREMMRSDDLTTGRTSPTHLLKCYQAKRQIEQCLAHEGSSTERLKQAAVFLRRYLSLPKSTMQFLDDETSRLSPHLARLPIDAFDASEPARIENARAIPRPVPPPKSWRDYGIIWTPCRMPHPPAP